MAINKKLITFDKKLTFLGANGINNLLAPVDGYYNQIPTWSMVFIKDTGEIWHDGVYFGKPIKDQIAPIMSGTTKGLVFTPDGESYYYKTFNLWGNTFDGDTININGDLVVQGANYKWTYGDAGIKKGNTYLVSFSNGSNNYDVFVPNGDLKISSGDINVKNGNIILSSTGSIKGTHILNTNSYFNADNTLGKTWNSIKLFSTSGTTISLDTTRPAIINILEHAHASGTLWVPWIAGGDITEQSSWGIGLGGDAFYIGRIAKSHTENSLSEYWKFDSEDGITISGTTKYIKVAGLTGASEKIFMADGTIKAISDLSIVAQINEATTTDYGGFKLTQAKASTQQALVSNTTGNGRYAVKMNANGTLYVEFAQANTWKAANNSQEGYVPKLSGNGTIGTQSTEYVLTFTSGGTGTITPTWKLLPANAFKNDNTWKAANSSQEGYVPKSTASKILRSDANGALYWGNDSNTWKEVTTSLEGYVPKIVTTGSLTATDSPFILVFKNVSGSTKTAWVPLPANAFKNDNTWTPWKGATESANGTAGYMPAPTSALRGKFLRGDGSWVSLNNYSLPTASNSTLGGVKTGAAITDTTGYTAVAIKDGVIYYKDTNTTYSFSNLLFLQTSGTNLMTYNSQAVRTVLAGSNITFTHSNNILTIAAKDTTYSTVSKSAAGLCPTLPNETTTTKYLRLDGTWQKPPNDNTWKAANSSQEGYVPKSKANKILRANADGALYWGDDANTTYTFYNLLFQNSGGTTVDTYKPTTSPTKTLKAGANVTISAASNVITIASTNTWNANAVGVAGYVAAPTKAANANMTWLTDAEGVPAWRASNNHSHNYLSLSGGNVSDNISLKGSFDLTKSNNNVGSTIWPTTFNILDSGNRISARLENVVQSNGTNGFFLYVRLYNSNGTMTALRGLSYNLTKADTPVGTWTVHDPASFRTALGLGARATDNTEYLPKAGGTLTGSLVLKGSTTDNMTYSGNVHPYIRFDNSDSSLNVSLIFTDYDSYRSPAGIKLVGNQGNEWFEAPVIYLNGTKVSVEGHNHNRITSLGNKDASDLSNTYPSGLSVAGIYNNGYPFAFGSTITANGNGGHFQIAGQWNSAVSSLTDYDYPTEMYIRGRRDSYNVWTTWTRVLTNRNWSSVITLPTKASWNYDDRYVSSLTTNGNSLRWVKNGSNNDITIPYATNADMVDNVHLENILTYTTVIGNQTQNNHNFHSALKLGVYEIHYGGYIANHPSDWEDGSNHYGQMLHFGHAADNHGYILLDRATLNMYFKNIHSTDEYGAWYKIAHSGNSSVSKSGETLTVKINGTSQSLTNTWRGIQDNLTSSTDTTRSLSAKQGYLLANGSARDNTKLPLTGGTMTGNITFSGDNYISWSRNTDSAKIHFKNTGDGDSDSYLGFETADNGNEYFRFGHTSGTYTEWMSIKSDGVRVKGTLVSLNGHKHAYTDLTGSSTTANQAIVSSGTANGWTLKTLGSRAFDSTSYLPLSGGTMTGIETISTTSAISLQNRTSSGTRASYYTSGNYIHGGEDHADQDGANVQIGTWYGFGIYPTISGQTRTQGKNSFWHNARTGNTYTWGEFYSYDGSTNRKVLHEGNSSVSLSGSTLTVKINGTSRSLTNTWRGIQDNLTSSSNTTESLSAKQGYLLANGSARDSTKLPLAGGTMVGTVSASSDAYGGGGFHNGYANIILRGNTTTGTSGIVFSSSKGDTSINRHSDCAFIQYHPYGISAATAVGTNPTINTSGESGRFVIGIHNDSGDLLWLQTSAVNDLKHVVGANVYTIYDSGNLPAYPTKSSWNYDDRYVASVSISGNNLRVNKNGTNTDLTIPYATNSDTVDGYHASSFSHTRNCNGGKYTKFMTFTRSNEKGWMRLSCTISDNSGQKGGEYLIAWGYDATNTNKEIFIKCLYGYRQNADASLYAVRVDGSKFDLVYASGSTGAFKLGFTLYGYSESTTINNYTIATYTDDTKPTATYTSNAESLITNISGNASTATTLQTSRTVWGQSFDGSANVDGTPTINTTTDWGVKVFRNASQRTVYSVGKAESKFNLGYYGFHHVTDGSNTNYLTLGLYGADELVNILGNGNVGIGTTSPSYKLHVNGSANATTLYENGTSLAKKYLALAGGTVSGVIKPNANSTINLGENGAKFHYLYVHRLVNVQSICNGTTYDSNKLDLPSKSGTIAVTSDLNSYLPLSGGTMSGSINFAAASAAYSSEGIRFKNGTTESTRIGADTGNGLGLYATGSIYIRPNVTLGSASTNGLVVSSSAFTYNGNNVLTSNNSSVSKSGETLTVKINGTSQSLTNTWRGIQNNLTSDSTTDSLSAAQGKALNGKFASYLPLSGGILTGNLSFSNSGTGFRGINYGTMGDNDQWRIGGAATGSNAGYMEIATADDGAEPIYVRQYTGVFSSLKRTATLLDGSGNTSFPGTVSASSFSGNVTGNCSGSAGSVTWANVSSKPAATGNATTPVYWNGSGFTNCTAYASASVNYATSAGYLTDFTRVSRVSKNSDNTEIESVSGWKTAGFILIQKFCPPTMYRTTEDAPAPYGIGFGNGGESGGIIPIGLGDKLEEIRFYGANSGPTIFTFGRQLWEDSSYDTRKSNKYITYLSINSTNGNLTTSGTVTAPTFVGNLTGSASTLGTYAESAFLRHRATTNVNGEATLWSQLGLKQYNGALPESLSGIYNWGQVVSFATQDARFEIYASHQSSNPSNATNGLYYRTGWGNDKRQWTRFLDSNNSSVSKSGETLTVKINGTSQSLTNTNTTYSAGKGLRLSGTQFISDAPRVAKDSKVFGGQYTWIMEEYTSGANYNLPSNAWYHIMSTQGADTKYGTQLALGMTTEGAYYRVYNNGSWGSWKSLINTDTTYSANNGVGLSGTTFYNTGVRATTINGNYLRVNTNGTNADLTIPYATNAYLLHSVANVNGGNTHTYLWRRIAFSGERTGNWNDCDALILIKHNYNGGRIGLLKISFRTDEITAGANASASATWLVRDGFTSDSVKVALYKVKNKAYADIYLSVGNYPRCTVHALKTSGWTFYDSNESDSSANPVNAYTSVESAATAIHGVAYTSITNSGDGTTVNYANSAGSVTWTNVSSKPATATRWPAWSEVTGKPGTFAPSAHNHNGSYSYAHQTTFAFNEKHDSNYVTFDLNNPAGAPDSDWYNGFVTTHNGYLSSYIINGHRSANWYVGYSENSTAPTWYKLIHSGNIGSLTVQEANRPHSRGTVYNVNTVTDGIIYNYASEPAWLNAPSGMSYGSVLTINPSYWSGLNYLGLQLAWDVNHGSSTNPGKLWFRTSNEGAPAANNYWVSGWSQVITSAGGLTINGSLTASSFYTTSDIRTKKDISNISEHVRKFKFKKDNSLHYGFIALELEVEHPELVDNLGEYKTVDYNSALSLLLAKAENKIKELENRIKLLEDGKNS